MKDVECFICESKDVKIVEANNIVFYKCELCSNSWGQYIAREK